VFSRLASRLPSTDDFFMVVVYCLVAMEYTLCTTSACMVFSKNLIADASSAWSAARLRNKRSYSNPVFFRADVLSDYWKNGFSGLGFAEYRLGLYHTISLQTQQGKTAQRLLLKNLTKWAYNSVTHLKSVTRLLRSRSWGRGPGLTYL